MRGGRCPAVDVQPKFETFDATDDKAKLAYVTSKNLMRRDLSQKERIAIAASLANISHGHNRHREKVDGSPDPSTFSDPPKPVSTAEAAKSMGVSPSSVKRKRQVDRHAEPEVQEAYESGEMSLKAASAVATKPREEQVAAVEETASESENLMLFNDLNYAIESVNLQVTLVVRLTTSRVSEGRHSSKNCSQ